MFAFLKGVFAGAVLAFAGAEIAGRLGSTAGLLHVFRFEVHETSLYWSWPLFVVATGLGWAIFAMLE